jgi:Zn-dependent alcohol dehydrogenase
MRASAAILELRLRGGGAPADDRAGPALDASRRHDGGGGVCPAGTRLSIDPTMFLQQRVLTGTSFGGGHQRTDVPMLIDLFMAGRYRLRELISRRLPLGEINEAFDLLRHGEVKRSVIVYE